jgi:hypothetical protein
MDRERAEAHLRRFAEVQLRCLRPGGPEDVSWRVSAVGEALTEAGTLDADVAEAVNADFEFALAVRGRRLPSTARVWYGRGTSVRRPGRQRPPAGPAQPPPRPDRIVPLDLRLSLGSGEDRHELYLLAFGQDEHGAWFAAHVRPASPAPIPRPDSRTHPPFSGPIRDLLGTTETTDDSGTSYQLTFHDGYQRHGFHAQLGIYPDPPPEISWAEITAAGEPAVRVDLAGPGPGPDATLTPAALTSGEFLLHTYAARLLGQGALPVAGMLGVIVAALRESGALSPLSPVPGQLAALCERHGHHGHGISAPVARDEDLPEPWRSDSGEATSGPHPRDRFATAAVALPELDGVRLTILSLSNGVTQTSMHVHAAGLPASRRHDSLPVLWLRDDRGRWHATEFDAWTGDGYRSIARLLIWPPLNGVRAVDILARGRSAEVRTTLPLHWR